MDKAKNEGVAYVCGFLFTATHHEMNVALVMKRHGPEVVVGKYNGIGGKIEEGELPSMAMRREFKEEAGVDISSWELFCTMEVPPWGKVYMYSTTVPGDVAKQVKAQEDEEISWIDVRKMPYYNVVGNLKWLIPMALDTDHVHSTSKVIYG